MDDIQVDAATFRPRTGPYAQQLCRGVRLRVVRPNEFLAMPLGYALVAATRSLYPEQFKAAGLLKLIGHRPTFEALLAGQGYASVNALSEPERRSLERESGHWQLYE